MYRVRVQLPLKLSLQYRYLDILHDALINAWTTAGAPVDWVMGRYARAWTFAPLGTHRKDMNQVHTLVVSTADVELGRILRTLEPAMIAASRAQTGEVVDFRSATILPDFDPIVSGTRSLGVLMLSPLAISHKLGNDGRRWHTDVRETDLSSAISSRLSRLAGRPIRLTVTPDSFYVRMRPRHSSAIWVKQSHSTGRPILVVGMRVPLVLAGEPEDLRWAYYAGVGEQTRMGFGCVGSIEQGVGRA